MIFFTHKQSPRLLYIADFIGKQILQDGFLITSDRDEYLQFKGPRINYSSEKLCGDEYWVIPHTLLFEGGIKQQTVECFDLNGETAFFKTTGDHAFDIFAASFYLLSRYEEYFPYQPDRYGRFNHEDSLAFKGGFLNRPLINYWIEAFKKNLEKKFPHWKARVQTFSFIPTYDIDEAYSFKHKSGIRTAGAYLKSLLKGRTDELKERRLVLTGRKKDPFDSFEWMHELHQDYKLSPKYFFLIPASTGKYDRNILPSNPALQNLIREHAEKYQVGIHPSWQSGDDSSLLEKEIRTLESITGKRVIASRQHFIRLKLPDTFRQLLQVGIREDYSMGYGAINGFRAAVSSPFHWYDLELDQRTELLLYPFCFMEAISFYEQNYSPAQAQDELQKYYDEVRKVNGTFCTLWHNTFLGTDKKFRGWREVYENFISKNFQQHSH